MSNLKKVLCFSDSTESSTGFGIVSKYVMSALHATSQYELEQLAINHYLTRSIFFQFPFTRKMVITAPTTAFVFYPGGFGTLHQLFEVLTLIQTKKIKKRPVILYDHAFWEPLHHYIKKVFVHEVHTINDNDDEMYQIVDDTETAIKIIQTYDKKQHHHADPVAV